MSEGTEIIGVLASIEAVDGVYKLTFTFQREIEVPASKIQTEDLRVLKGHRAGIIRIGNRYKVRRI